MTLPEPRSASVVEASAVAYVHGTEPPSSTGIPNPLSSLMQSRLRPHIISSIILCVRWTSPACGWLGRMNSSRSGSGIHAYGSRTLIQHGMVETWSISLGEFIFEDFALPPEYKWKDRHFLHARTTCR
ncbi:unnamed protein product [Penicillium roqueforti FM164]|uniref:Genomic scaffold, ProqFM164S02 n=1 Tax=Penicillium roqueforti (strain FM164) TaxID=1365484 RepID=W6Q390_PENRF|nr:unnamed protein product [Penicillium roqueforti FM164]